MTGKRGPGEFHLQGTTDRQRRALQGVELDPVVLRIQQSVDLRATRLHSRRQVDFVIFSSAIACSICVRGFGGMPYYLSLCDPERPLAENVLELMLQNGAPLRDEPDHLLQAELQNVARYASMLRAVPEGCTKRPEIASRVLSKGEEATSLTPYFRKLEALRLIRTEVSLDVRDPDRTQCPRPAS